MCEVWGVWGGKESALSALEFIECLEFRSRFTPSFIKKSHLQNVPIHPAISWRKNVLQMAFLKIGGTPQLKALKRTP
jgi:hypothetical protein